MTREQAIAAAKHAYVFGRLAVDAFEAEVERILSPDWRPPSMAAALKEMWTQPRWLVPSNDAPGAVHYYRAHPRRERYNWGDGKGRVHAISLEEHDANLRALREGTRWP
jgi:hypothetical protein